MAVLCIVRANEIPRQLRTGRDGGGKVPSGTILRATSAKSDLVIKIAKKIPLAQLLTKFKMINPKTTLGPTSKLYTGRLPPLLIYTS